MLLFLPQLLQFSVILIDVSSYLFFQHLWMLQEYKTLIIELVIVYQIAIPFIQAVAITLDMNWLAIEIILEN